MGEPCPLCGREKLKDRVQRPPPMTDDVESFCLHSAHIYSQPLPPCEALGVDRIKVLQAEVSRLRASLENVRKMMGPRYREQFVMLGPRAFIPVYDEVCATLDAPGVKEAK
jgi:hypothetical protein